MASTSSRVPSIIVLALGAGALGFPDALRLLLLDLQIAGRNPLIDVSICFFAMAAVTAQALGAVLLARFVRKPANARTRGHSPQRTDWFAQLTLAVSLGAAFLVSACLLVVVSGAGGFADIARNTKSPVIAAVLATGAVVLPWAARPLLRVFREAAVGVAVLLARFSFTRRRSSSSLLTSLTAPITHP